jgi:hypothetical protein
MQPLHNVRKGNLVVFQLSEVRKISRTFDEFAYGMPTVTEVKRTTYARRVVAISTTTVTVKMKGRLLNLDSNVIIGCYK